MYPEIRKEYPRITADNGIQKVDRIFSNTHCSGTGRKILSLQFNGVPQIWFQVITKLITWREPRNVASLTSTDTYQGSMQHQVGIDGADIL